jgi:ribosome maturation factor RimP
VAILERVRTFICEGPDRGREHLEVGFTAHLFFALRRVAATVTEEIQERIERTLDKAEPDVEVLLVERASAGVLRLVIDSPGGVDLGLCERVTGHLRGLLDDVGLEVSSPGPERPLTKPDHFRRFIGRRARIRTCGEHAGVSSFTGELVGADGTTVTVAAGDGVVSIPYTDIKRSNLVED